MILLSSPDQEMIRSRGRTAAFLPETKQNTSFGSSFKPHTTEEKKTAKTSAHFNEVHHARAGALAALQVSTALCLGMVRFAHTE